MNIKIEESNGKKKYWVNGIAYDRMEDIPAEFKSYFSDTNNNGIPDQFDGLMNTVNKMGVSDSFGSVFKSLLSTADLNELKASASSKTFSSGTNGSSFAPTLIKIIAAGLIVFVVAWMYPKFQAAQPSGSPANGTTVSSDSSYQIPTSSPASPDRMTFSIDDPNEPPYHMLGVVSQNGEKIFTFELPDGQEIESTDSSLQTAMPVEPGTNLIEKTFSLSILNEGCTSGEEETPSSIVIGENYFSKTENEDYGMSQTYKTYRYSFEKEGKCVVFTLLLHSSSPEVLIHRAKNLTRVLKWTTWKIF